MRVTVKVDGATPYQIYDLTLAFQRTRGIELPRQITTTPTVSVGGTAMSWESPAMQESQAVALLKEFDELTVGTNKALALKEVNS